MMGEVVTTLYSETGETGDLAETDFVDTIGSRQLCGGKARIITHISNPSGSISLTVNVYARVGGKSRYVASHTYGSITADTSLDTVVDVCPANLSVKTTTTLNGETYDLDVNVVRI